MKAKSLEELKQDELERSDPEDIGSWGVRQELRKNLSFAQSLRAIKSQPDRFAEPPKCIVHVENGKPLTPVGARLLADRNGQ